MLCIIWSGSVFADPYLRLTDPAPDPAPDPAILSVAFKVFLLISF
jgi:hypothetical protein